MSDSNILHTNNTYKVEVIAETEQEGSFYAVINLKTGVTEIATHILYEAIVNADQLEEQLNSIKGLGGKSEKGSLSVIKPH